MKGNNFSFSFRVTNNDNEHKIAKNIKIPGLNIDERIKSFLDKVDSSSFEFLTLN